MAIPKSVVKPGKTKTCNKCGKTFDIVEGFRVNRAVKDGYMNTCRWCSSKDIKAHYRKWDANDVAQRGETGVRCILWAKRCGVCNWPDDNDCWRLEGNTKTELPRPLTKN